MFSLLSFAGTGAVFFWCLLEAPDWPLRIAALVGLAISSYMTGVVAKELHVR